MVWAWFLCVLGIPWAGCGGGALGLHQNPQGDTPGDPGGHLGDTPRDPGGNYGGGRGGVPRGIPRGLVETTMRPKLACPVGLCRPTSSPFENCRTRFYNI